jgi:zinc protease
VGITLNPFFTMRRLPSFAAIAVSLALALSLRAAIPFPQAESDLHADPAIAFGTLPNGVRYAVMPNHEPKGRVSLRLLVLAGSFEETEAQRGLAHYLEHMAFNGSTHYAPGTLVEKLQRLGMGFGADTNASTSFDHTLYQLELPDTAPATLAEGLQILADYGGGLLLEQKMVDKERGIILSEKRTRDSVGYRTMVAQLEFMEGGTRIPSRLPIGLTDVIEKSNRDLFVDFYNTWYRPENLVVVVVGDIDGSAVEKQIVAGFSALAPRSPEPVPADLGKVEVFTGVKALFHGEPESPDTRIVIASSVPYEHEADTGANRIKYLPRELAVEMLNRRLEILAKKENAPFTRASTSVEESFNLVRVADIDVTCKPDQWILAMNMADQELRRALAFGFGPDELKEAVADFRNNIEQAVKSASTRLSDALAGDIAESLVDREVFTSPADDLALYGPALDKVTPAECIAALKQAWASPSRYVFVAGNLKIAGDPNIIVQGAYERAEFVDVRPNDARGAVTWGYSSFGEPGAVATKAHIDDLDFTQVTFANGVRLNIKKTDFEADTIQVGGRLGTGQLTEPAGEPGLATFTKITYSAGGLAKHSADDLQRILAGKQVGVQFSTSMDAFVLGGHTNKEDLGLELELLTATIEDPGYRPEALRAARKRILEAYLSFEHTVQGPNTLQVARILAGGDPRFGLPGKDEMMARNMDEMKAWIAPEAASGALEVSIVGDVDVDAAIGLAARTIGTLPMRDPKPPLDELRKVAFPATPFVKDLEIDTKIPKALVEVYYPTADGMDVHRARRLNVLAEVLSDRLRVKVREQMGSTYSPSAGSSASDIFPGYGYVSALVEVDPAKAREIQNAVVSVAADLQANGVTQDELDRAKNPALKHIEESERTNAYWMTVLGRSQEKPEVLDWARSRRTDFGSISKADIDALAKAYLAPANASRVIIRPALLDFSPLLRPGPIVTPTPPPDGT